MMKKLLIIISIIIIPLNLISSESISDAFKLKLHKPAIATFSFEPSEILEFTQSSDVNTQAEASVTVKWTINFDTDKTYSLSLEAKSTNDSIDGMYYCMENINNINMGLNFLMKVDGVLVKDLNAEGKMRLALDKADRSCTIVSQEDKNNIDKIPQGDAEISLSIPMPTDDSGQIVNGVYQGYLILTLTYD